MAEANRSIEEIVESAHSASSSHRPVGPFGPIPKNSGMEQDGTFARTPIVAGEMPRRRSNTSTASAAYHTVQGSGTDGSESAGYRTTSEHAAETGALAPTDSLLPSQLAKNYKATNYWSRSGESSSARGSVSAEQGRRGSGVFVTSGSSSRSEPAASRTRAAARRQQETAEAMTYEERHSVRGGGRRSSDHERYRNVSSSAESSAGARPARFPFQRAENGGMRVSEGMVAYQDRNLAILVADPVHTRLRVQAKEKHAKSTGSVTDRMSADIHASYENLSTIQQRAARDASAERRSSGGSQRAGAERRDQFYETSEYGSQRRQETPWEAESSGHERSEQRSSRAGGGSGRAMSERSAGGASRPGSRASVSRRDSGLSFEFRDQLGVSGSASSVAEQSSSRRRSLSPRPAASAHFSQADDAPGTLQRVMQPAEDTVAVDDGQETDGFTTRFVRQETAGSRKAASATTLYMAPAAGAAGRGGPAATSGAGGFSQADGGMDEAGYPRRASGDWRRRSSAAELVIEDEVCDLEEREEVVSVGQKERISYHRTDAESSLEKSARRTQQQQQYSNDNERAIPGGYQRYSGASGGAREKRELGCLSEEAVRSSSSLERETDCYIEVDGIEVPLVSWAVRRYSRYLQQLGRNSPRRLKLPQGSGSPEALATVVEWCYLPARDANRLVTTDNCADIYRVARALEIPELMEQCRRLLDREEPEPVTRGGVVTFESTEVEERSWRPTQSRTATGEYGSAFQLRVDVLGEEEEEDSSTPRQRPRRSSSFGSSSPKRSYSRLYTREEHEAAVVIQSGYRGFRARQQLKEQGIELGGSGSRRRSATGASYSRRVSSTRTSQSRQISSPRIAQSRPAAPSQSYQSGRMASSQSTYSQNVSSSTPRLSSSRSEGATGQRSRSELQKQTSGGSARGGGDAAMRQPSQRKPSEAAADGFRTVYEHRSTAAVRPSTPESRRDTGPSQTATTRTSRRDNAARSPARSRSRSGSRSRVSFRGDRPSSGTEEYAAVVIQRNFRAFSARVHYEEKRYAAATIQRFMRGHLARKQVREMHEAATKIQNCFREHLHEKRARMDPEVNEPVSRVVSSSSDWKCRSLLHPEGSTVLVMAGLNPMQDYCAKYNSGRDMYRYQAFQNAWEYVGQVPEPRHHVSVAHLRGLVYLLGGTDPSYRDGSTRCRPLNTVWVLDPSTGDWWQGPPMRHARIHHGTAVAQGQLYVIGGQDADGCALTSVELFDPDRNSWCELEPLACARIGVAAAVHHHRIWVVGGMCPVKKQDVVNTVDIYDTIRKRWCQGPPLRQPRCFARLVVCAHRLFLIGGAGRSTRHQKAISSVDTVDRFSEEQRAWVHVAQMKTSRHGHAVVPQSELEFLILGGVSSQDAVALSLVEQYNARSNQWVRGVARLPSPLSGLAAVTIPPPRRKS